MQVGDSAGLRHAQHCVTAPYHGKHTGGCQHRRVRPGLCVDMDFQSSDATRADLQDPRVDCGDPGSRLIQRNECWK
jgi:hypothetical protein